MSEINCNNCAICDFKESLCHWCDEMKRLGSAEDIEKVLIEAFSETKSDCISRQEVIDALCDNCDHVEAVCPHFPCKQYIAIRNLPLIQPTLCGYDIEHLMLIAEVLRKENLPPERVAEALTDIGQIVSIVRDEFEESLRKAVEQCMI